jgi:polyisoprenyl-phosphate glycosyltransferase
MSGARHTLVIPVFNEEPVLRELHRRLTASLTRALADRGESWEAIFVDDGSLDGTAAVLRALRDEDPAHVRVVAFSRNFGHAAAMTAGIDHADGDTVITMDADLQDPPETVPELIARWREGFDVVYAVRTERKSETVFKKATAALFYRLLRASSEIEIPLDAGDFRLMSRRAALALASMRERHRLLRGMSRWVGFKQTSVAYAREARRAGETKFTVRRMSRLAWDGFTSFSLLPLRIATLAGAVAAPLGALAEAWVIAARLAGGPPLHRTAAVIAAVLAVGGLQLLALGVLGEYVGRLFEEIKRRPLYVVDYTLGFPGEAASPIRSSRGSP